jgi:hypothetical protein
VVVHTCGTYETSSTHACQWCPILVQSSWCQVCIYNSIRSVVCPQHERIRVRTMAWLLYTRDFKGHCRGFVRVGVLPSNGWLCFCSVACRSTVSAAPSTLSLVSGTRQPVGNTHPPPMAKTCNSSLLSLACFMPASKPMMMCFRQLGTGCCSFLHTVWRPSLL